MGGWVGILLPVCFMGCPVAVVSRLFFLNRLVGCFSLFVRACLGFLLVSCVCCLPDGLFPLASLLLVGWLGFSSVVSGPFLPRCMSPENCPVRPVGGEPLHRALPNLTLNDRTKEKEMCWQAIRKNTYGIALPNALWRQDPWAFKN